MEESSDATPMCSLPERGMRRVLITGANSGLGLDTARQLAQDHPDTATEIILAVRSQAKGDGAIAELVKLTGRPASLFSVLIVSVGDLDSCKAAAEQVTGRLDGVVLNAGGMSGGVTKDAETGVLTQFNVNTLGHALFLEELIRLGKLNPNAHVLFVGSFAARGVSSMGLAFPEYGPATADAVSDIITGTAIKPLTVEMVYGYAKSVMALYASALARRHPEFCIFTVSPGSTTGTDGAKHAPLWARVVLKVLGPWVLVPLGVMHTKEKGAARFVQVLLDTRFKSGLYLGSTYNKMTGPLEDQALHYPIFGDEAYQEAAFEAVHRFI
eukprot:m.488168 g.488168  ORF g.488168 m.488168 type:complete len:326 (+) comp25601_c0_seq1:325-1302(+)